MTAVGLTDVFEYGSKFLGYLVAVAVIAGGLLGAGTYLIGSGGASVTDPSLGALTGVRPVAGTGLAVLGAFVGVAGLVGMAHKFVVDVFTVAIEQSAVSRSSTTVPAPAEASDSSETEASDSAETETDDPAEPASPAGTPPSRTREPATPDSSDERAQTAVPSVSDDGEQSEPQPATDPTAGETPETGTPVADDGPDEPTAADPVDTGSAGQPVEDQETIVEAQDAEPAEWTPPDPDEFERKTGSAQDEASLDTEETEWAESEDEGTEQGWEPDSGQGRTWAQIRDGSASPGPDVSGRSEDAGVGGSEPTDAVEPGEDDVVAGSPEGDTDAGADPDEPEADDLTLADEGLSSVDVAADEDPLADRLPGDDS